MSSPDQDILAAARHDLARQQLQALLVILGLGLVILFIVGLILQESETLYLTGINALILAAISWLRSRDKVTAAAMLASLALLATGIWGTWTSRFGLLDSTVVVILAALIYGTLLLSHRPFMIMLAVTTLSVLVVGFREPLGLAYGPDANLTLPIDVAVVMVTVVLVSLAVRRQNNLLWKTLRRAVSNERDLASSHAELQRRQEQAVASEARWRTLVTAAPEWIVQLDANGTIVFANREEFFHGDALGKPLTDLVEGAELPDLAGAIGAALHEGRTSSVEVSVTVGDARQRCVFHLGPLEAGGAIVLVSDVTERRRLQEQLLQTQKLESIGQLAGGIAHDFNNLLTVISGHADLAQMKLNETDPMNEDLEIILRTCDHATALTRQILAFSRRQPLRPEPVDLAAAIGKMHRMLQRLIGEDIRLEESLETDLPLIKADPGSVEQVVMNLMVNARDAIRDLSGGGDQSIHIATRLRQLDSQMDGLEPGSYVELSVRDSGIGMDASIRSRIFEPFFTTKEPGRGTGLGLATVYGIVAQSEGTIQVVSTPGQGTTFLIYWPTTDSGASLSPTEPPAVGPLNGDEHLLVVEDEKAVRDLAVLALRRQGYQVTAASDAQEALDLVENGSRFELVISDVVMPGLNGFELRDRLPDDMLVILCSGHTDLSWLPDGELPAPELFLPKPYGPHDLARKVRHLLDAGRSS